MESIEQLSSALAETDPKTPDTSGGYAEVMVALGKLSESVSNVIELIARKQSTETHAEDDVESEPEAEPEEMENEEEK